MGRSRIRREVVNRSHLPGAPSIGNEQGGYVAVEIKRRGEIDGLEQLGRYLERLRPALGAVRGVLAAQAFTQQARTLAAARGINCVALDYDALRGMEPNTPTLF